MRAKKGCGKRAAEIRKEILDIRRSIHGYAFCSQSGMSEEVKNKLRHISELECELEKLID